MGRDSAPRPPISGHMSAPAPTAPAAPITAPPQRVLGVACGAHALHDGFTDALYVLLPVWQAEFGLSYAAVGLMRAIYTGVMAAFQVPAGHLAARLGGPLLLAAGTALAGAGFLLAGFSSGLMLLATGLIVSGIGASVQHPIASDLVAHSFAPRTRTALGAYNFAGDLGKMLVPAGTALLLQTMAWRQTVWLLGAAGLLVGALILPALRSIQRAHRAPRADADAIEIGAAGVSLFRVPGFAILTSIGCLDSATRMGFLTFLPFLLVSKGADVATIGLALSLVFAGGAAGKLACGFLGERLGFFRTVLITELATACGILLLLPMPLIGCMGALPIIGVALNGTSSVLYGSVPEFVPAAQRARAFGVFYTGTIGGGALSPIAYGLVSDITGIPMMMMIIAAVVIATLPLAWRIRARLEAPEPDA
jgi:FSR family fosmidomycin resistance protein-like MFS transporter